MFDTFTNTVLLFFLFISWPSYLQLTFLITEWVYLDYELAVIILVDCRALTYFMKSCSLAPNVLTSMCILWALYISVDSTTNDSSSGLRYIGLPNLIFEQTSWFFFKLLILTHLLSSELYVRAANFYAEVVDIFFQITFQCLIGNALLIFQLIIRYIWQDPNLTCIHQLPIGVRIISMVQI